MTLLFAIDRGPDGYPRLTPPPEGKSPTRQEVFERRCYMLGITERADVVALWAKEAERLRALEAKSKKGKGRKPTRENRRGTGP